MLLSKYEREIDKLVLQSIENDKDTYVDDSEQEMVLRIVQHFFDEYDFNSFGDFNADIDTYNKYYKEHFQKHYPTLEKEYIQKVYMEEENES